MLYEEIYKGFTTDVKAIERSMAEIKLCLDKE